MSLDLNPDQPAETMPDQPPTLATICTLITVDAVPVRVSERPDGSLVIQPGSRNPLVLDRHQAGALRSALAEGD